jgi:hypothetical protein
MVEKDGCPLVILSKNGADSNFFCLFLLAQEEKDLP